MTPEVAFALYLFTFVASAAAWVWARLGHTGWAA